MSDEGGLHPAQPPTPDDVADILLRRHWPALLAADFFTTEVWTHRGLLTYFTTLVIELHSSTRVR